MDTTGIPHPPWRIPFLGEVFRMNPRTPVQDTIRWARVLGPIFTRKIFGTEIVVVSDPGMVAELNDDKKFSKHIGFGIENFRAVTGDGLFTAYTTEPNWRLAHDILQPAFTLEAMRGYHPAMVDVARELLASWDTKAGTGTVDVAADMTKLTLETIGRTGFGYRFDSFEREQPHPFVVAMNDALLYAQLQSIRLPFLRRMMAGPASANKAAIQSMKDLVDEVISARDPGQGEDLLAMMLASPHPVTGERLDPVNIRNQVITFIVAGHETTSGALSFALYYLTRNPEALAKAQAEVDAMWGDQPDPEPTFTEVTKLRYVRRVLDESMRLWPTAPGYFRGAREDVVLGGKYPMHAGDHALVMLPLLHRDPTVWGPDPEAFDPDRFAPGEAKKRPAHAYKPFGTGERACIGRQFAIHEAVLALGLVLHRYEFTPDPGYELRIAESLTLKTDGFRLGLRRRVKPNR